MRLHLFKPGTWTAMSGQTLTFTEADLRAIAEGYDPAKSAAPLVVGHPAVEDPAYGWVDRLEMDAEGLWAFPKDVEPQFAEMVNAGRFRRISMAVLAPAAPGNPTPGRYYLRHVGFLGAAAPAVSGLKPARFAAEAKDLVVVEFAADGSDDPMNVVSDQARSASGLKPEAASLKPDFQRAGGSSTPPAGAATLPPGPVFAKGGSMAEKPAAPPAPDLKQQEEALAAREKALADREAALKRQEFTAFCDGLVKGGKLLPLFKDRVVTFMAALPEGDTLEFATADGKPGKQSPVAFFREFLQGQPEIVPMGERAPAEPTPAVDAAFAAPAGTEVDRERLVLHNRALAYQATHPDTDYLTAVKAVGGR